jgi:hypothetical protein
MRLLFLSVRVSQCFKLGKCQEMWKVVIPRQIPTNAGRTFSADSWLRPECGSACSCLVARSLIRDRAPEKNKK